MKHPIYTDFNIKSYFDLYQKYISNPHIEITQFNKSAINVCQGIISNNHIIIDATSYNWQSKISESTLQQLSLNDFKFPFFSGVLLLDKRKYYYTIIPNNSIQIIVVESTQKRKLLIYPIDSKIKISELKGISFDFFTAIFYISTFKNDTTRVHKQKKVKAKKDKKTPKHTINIIKLEQKIQLLNTIDSTSTHNKSDKSWIVRGHWRLQRYKNTNKPKWIDPYWKGVGKKQIEKIYKV